MVKIPECFGEVIRLAFPEVCHFCGSRRPDSDIEYLCKKCASSIPFRSKNRRKFKCVDEVSLIRSHLPLSNNITVISACYYEDPVRRSLLRMKFHDEAFHYKEFGGIIAKIIENGSINCDYIIPVPLHRSREKERGYNQTMLIAKRVGELTGIKILDDCLIRIRETKRQSEAGSREGRLANMENAFEWRYRGSLKNRSLLILDDVLTSGTTMLSAAKAILSGSAGNGKSNLSKEDTPGITGMVLASDR